MDIFKCLYNKQRGVGESGGLSRQHTVIMGRVVFIKVCSSRACHNTMGNEKGSPLKNEWYKNSQ